MVSTASLEGFYYRPRIDWDLLERNIVGAEPAARRRIQNVNRRKRDIAVGAERTRKHLKSLRKALAVGTLGAPAERIDGTHPTALEF
jgi:hypothetical protein